MMRLKQAWLVLTGELVAIEHSIIHSEHLSAQSIRRILMSLATEIANLGVTFDNAIAASKSEATKALQVSQASEAAAVAKAADLQSQIDAAHAAVNALSVKLAAGTAPATGPSPAPAPVVDPTA